MKNAVTILRPLAGVAGTLALVLGLLFWTGNAFALIPLHMLLGVVVVLALWSLAALAARAGVSAGLVALAVVWGLAVPILGVTQFSLLPGSMHWLVQVVHLLVGLGAVGQTVGLAARIASREPIARGERQPPLAEEG